jgi:hypothetical protein
MAGGRPTVMTPETIAKLEEAYLFDCTDVEACFYADIDKATLYRYQVKHPEFCDKKEALKSSTLMKAKKIQWDDLDRNDSGIAQKVIERKEGTKVAVTGPDGGPLQVTEIRHTVVGT